MKIELKEIKQIINKIITMRVKEINENIKDFKSGDFGEKIDFKDLPIDIKREVIQLQRARTELQMLRGDLLGYISNKYEDKEYTYYKTKEDET